VHLVGGGLNERAAATALCLRQRGAQHQRVRRADRVDADGLTSVVAADELEQRPHAGSSGSMARRAAARKASMMPRIFKGSGTMPSSASDSSAVMIGAPALVSGETTIALPYRNAYTMVS